MKLWNELKRRKVVRALAAYAIFAWLLVQVVVTVEEPLGLPDWTDTLVIALLAAGFPVAMLLSWVFDLTKGGPVRSSDSDITTLQKSTVLTAGLLFIVAFLIVSHRVATGVWIFDQPKSGLRLENLTLVSTFPGSHTQPAISPDGTMVAFVSDTTEPSQIWVKNLAQGAAIQITHGEMAASRPVWSPAGDQIVFNRSDGNLWTVGPLGTPEPRILVERALNADFSPEGQRIVFDSGRNVGTANADGSDERRLQGVPERFFTSIWTQPAFSPDGEWIALFVQSSGPNGDYWVIPAQGGEARRLTFDYTQGSGPAWSADGQHILFASRRGGTQTVWMVPSDGGEPQPVTTGVGEDNDPLVSRDGTTLMYTNARVQHTIMLTDPETGRTVPVLQSRLSVYLPQPSPDGQQITFFSETATGVHAMRIDRDGDNLTQMTHGYREINIHPEYSADGEFIYFYRVHPEQALRKVAATGGPSTEVFPGFTWQTHMRVSENPAGDHIAFTRMEPPDWSKDRNLIKNLATGEEREVARPHMHGPGWSKDGQFLLGHRHNGEIAICPVSGAECEILMWGGEPVLGGQPKWSEDESKIYYRRGHPDPAMKTVWVVNRDGSDARQVMEYGPVQTLNQAFELTPDEQVLWVRYDRADDEIWTAEIP